MSDSPRSTDDVRQQPWVRAITTILGAVLTLGSVAWAADVYRRVGLQIYNEQFIAALYTVAMVLVFLHFPVRRGAQRSRVPWYDLAAAAAAVGTGSYLAVQYPHMVDLILLRPTDAVTVGCVMILLTLEALRRTTGNILVSIVAVFLLYGLFGDLVPGQLVGRAQDWRLLAAYLVIDVNGVLGTPLYVATTIVITFIWFGGLLSRTGGSQFFTDLALVSMGRFRGGSAKIAVAASALFGSISGSAVANVVATGVVTIPMIKRSGYPGYKAAAIEAVASTGGQLMPPVMGAAAFLMAEFLQVSYGTVVMAALVPSLLYYVALFIAADLEAARAGITRVPQEEIPNLRHVLGGWHFLLPFVVLMVGLFHFNMQPETAVLLSIVTLIVFAVTFGYHGRRPSPRHLLYSLHETGLAVLEILMICAAAGMVIGVLAISGLGFGLTMGLIKIGGGHLLPLLLLSAVVCIVLGMGLPTVGVYVLLAALVAPALVQVGITPIAAHLYVMYFGMMSMITPPVAIAAYAAAGLAGADSMRTGFEAVRFGWSAYLVPFLFVASPNLLLIGEPKNVAIAVTTALLGIWIASIGVVGYFQRSLAWPLRTTFFLAGVFALVPANAFPGASYTDVVGVTVGLGLIAREILIARRARRRAGVVESVECL
ncbi:MAG: TRAP transporter fused permease subunit [Deferrisomatales bacterium]|nr:TRAP transporter fused permease subunit [Deferrisomatales bacterium]